MIQSLERASTILHLFEQQPDWGITQIAEQMQLSKSTVFGLVSTLEHLGFLSKSRIQTGTVSGWSFTGLGIWWIQTSAS